MSQWDDDRKVLDSKIASLQALLQQRTQECDSLSQDRDLLVDERDRLARDWEVLSREQEALVDDATRAQQDADGQIQHLQRMLAQAQKAQQDKDAEAAQLQATVDNLSSGLDTSKGLYEALSSAVRMLTDNAQSLRDQLLAAMAAREEGMQVRRAFWAVVKIIPPCPPPLSSSPPNPLPPPP